MKCFRGCKKDTLRLSRPARGAWVEIVEVTLPTKVLNGRAPQGARGLKYSHPFFKNRTAKVAPRKGRVG